MQVAVQRPEHTSLSLMPLLVGSRAAQAQLPAPHPHWRLRPESRASNKPFVASPVPSLQVPLDPPSPKERLNKCKGMWRANGLTLSAIVEAHAEEPGNRTQTFQPCYPSPLTAGPITRNLDFPPRNLCSESTLLTHRNLFRHLGEIQQGP